MRAVKNPVCNTPKASSVNAGRIERASQKVEKRSRTSRSWFEGVSVERVCKVMPNTVRKCAWQITRRLAREKQVERPCGRSHNGQVSQFTKLNHFRERQKAGEWSPRLWRGTVMVSSGHWRGALPRVRICRPIWRPQRINAGTESRWLKMSGEPWKHIIAARGEAANTTKGVHYLETTDQVWWTEKGCMACCGHAGSNPWDLRARTQGIVDNEVAQTDNTSSNVSPGKTSYSLSNGKNAQLKQNVTALTAGRRRRTVAWWWQRRVQRFGWWRLRTPTPNARRCWQADQIGTEPLRTWTRAERSI